MIAEGTDPNKPFQDSVRVVDTWLLLRKLVHNANRWCITALLLSSIYPTPCSWAGLLSWMPAAKDA